MSRPFCLSHQNKRISDTNLLLHKLGSPNPLDLLRFWYFLCDPFESSGRCHIRLSKFVIELEMNSVLGMASKIHQIGPEFDLLSVHVNYPHPIDV